MKKLPTGLGTSRKWLGHEVGRTFGGRWRLALEKFYTRIHFGTGGSCVATREYCTVIGYTSHSTTPRCTPSIMTNVGGGGL